MRAARQPVPIGKPLLLVAVGVVVGLGIAAHAGRTRVPPLVRVAPFDIGARATAPAFYPWLGVRLQSLTGQIASALSVPDDIAAGAVVTQVFPRSPAARAGIEPGDVVLRLDGDFVRGSADLVRDVRAHRSGDAVTIELVRDGARKSLKARLDPVPAAALHANHM